MNWKDIPGYEGLYQASECGKIRSYDLIVKTKRGWSQLRKGKVLKAIQRKDGYFVVSLCKEGHKAQFFVHRLIIFTFLRVDDSLTVNHIDEDKSNNCISNLEYLSRGSNTKSWNDNHPKLWAEKIVKAQVAARNATGKKVLDTTTGIIFPSINSVTRYMYEEEGAKSFHFWRDKIQSGVQDRFKILNSN